MRSFASIFAVLLLSMSCLAQRTQPASESELAEITNRGRMLYQYDVAAWHSTDAVMELKPPDGSFERYIAKKEGSGWTVAYGKLNASRDKFLIVYEASQGAKPDQFTVKKLTPPKEDKGFYLFASRAVDLAVEEFGTVTRPHNVAVVPAANDQFYVYVMPAQTKVGVYPLGGDARYLVSRDGSKIIEKRQMHRSVIEFSVPEGMKLANGYHTAILDDVPEDSDVFHVLTRQPSVIEWVVTNKYVYRILTDGSIMYLMKKEAFLEIGKPGN